MPTCVSEGSYNVLFIIAIVACVLFLLGSAYFYDRFKKAETDRLSSHDAYVSKSLAMVSMVVTAIFIALFFILYFGFQKRLVGVFATPHQTPTPVHL